MPPDGEKRLDQVNDPKQSSLNDTQYVKSLLQELLFEMQMCGTLRKWSLNNKMAFNYILKKKSEKR